MTVKSKLSSEKDIQTKRVNFGIKDKLGREKGIEIRTSVVTFTLLPSDARIWRAVAPGRYYAVLFHVTRNNRSYGPTQQPKYFTAKAERQAEIDRYRVAARKRAE